jgi:hypothetical protein
MENEKIELILLNAWLKEDDVHSIVLSNKRMYLIEHYKTLLELPTRGGSLLAIGFITHKIREFRKRDIIYEQEILKEMSIKDIQILAKKTFNYSDLKKQTVIRGDDNGIISFEYPTNSKILKTKMIEIGFPLESLNRISSYLNLHGFITRDINRQIDI